MSLTVYLSKKSCGVCGGAGKFIYNNCVACLILPVGAILSLLYIISKIVTRFLVEQVGVARGQSEMLISRVVNHPALWDPVRRFFSEITLSILIALLTHILYWQGPNPTPEPTPSGTCPLDIGIQVEDVCCLVRLRALYNERRDADV